MKPVPDPKKRNFKTNPTSEHSAAGRYMLFRRGFRDGAGTLAHRHPLEPDYMRGYEEGIKAAHDVALIFCKEINYDPMTGILR